MEAVLGVRLQAVRAAEFDSVAADAAAALEQGDVHGHRRGRHRAGCRRRRRRTRRTAFESRDAVADRGPAGRGALCLEPGGGARRALPARPRREHRHRPGGVDRSDLAARAAGRPRGIRRARTRADPGGARAGSRARERGGARARAGGSGAFTGASRCRGGACGRPARPQRRPSTLHGDAFGAGGPDRRRGAGVAACGRARFRPRAGGLPAGDRTRGARIRACAARAFVGRAVPGWPPNARNGRTGGGCAASSSLSRANGGSGFATTRTRWSCASRACARASVRRRRRARGSGSGWKSSRNACAGSRAPSARPGAPLAESTAMLDERLARRASLEAVMREARADVERVEGEVRGIDEDRLRQTAEVQRERETLERLRVESQETLVLRRAAEERLEAAGQELDGLLSRIGLDAEPDAWAEKLKAMERRIARLGPINLAAIEEHRAAGGTQALPRRPARRSRGSPRDPRYRDSEDRPRDPDSVPRDLRAGQRWARDDVPAAVRGWKRGASAHQRGPPGGRV